METYEEIYKKICRLCLKSGKSERMVSLIDNNIEDGLSAYGKAVMTFANICITKQDILPKMMCAKCLFLLKQSIYFKFNCESSETKLRELQNSVNSTDKSWPEKVIQYVLFRSYFPSDSVFGPTKPASEVEQVKKTFEVPITNNMKQNTQIMNEQTNSKRESKTDYNTIDSDIDNYSISSNREIQTEDLILDALEKVIGTSDKKVDQEIKIRKRKIKRKQLPKKKLKPDTKKVVQSKNKQERVCNVCHKVLANKVTFINHMQQHNGYRFICEHCGRGFAVLAELQMHLVARHGTGPYLQCKQCSFKAPRKHELIEHERLHTGERPYTCDKCGLTFRRRAIWKKHLIHHTEKKVECTYCSKKFFTRGEMMAHVNSVHDRLYAYLCSKCGVTYAKTATVRRHMTERHGIPREMQGKVIRVSKENGFREQ